MKYFPWTNNKNDTSLAWIDRTPKEFRVLVLNPSKIDPAKKIFRLKEKTRQIIFREDLKDEIVNAGCTGVQFPAMEDFGALLRTPECMK